MEDDHRPLVRREALEPAGDLVARLDLAREAARLRPRDIDDVDLDAGPLPVRGGGP